MVATGKHVAARVFQYVSEQTGRATYTVCPPGRACMADVAQVQEGVRCAACGHVSLEGAGCCTALEKCGVVVCRNCDTLHAAVDAEAHLRWCYGR